MKQTEDYSHRFRLAYGMASLAVGALTIGWGLVFAYMQAWSLAAMDAAVVMTAIASFALARGNQLSAALMFSQIAFFVIVVVFCLLFDVPSDAAPRVCHLFLLVLALLGYINYRREQSVAQLAVIALCLAAFVVFASTEAALPFAQPIADEYRLFGAWVNTIIAVVMLCGGVYVMQLEFARNLDQAREIRVALANREFELFYQPQVDETGRLTGAEALLRWKKADGSYAPPIDFIPLAEQAGLMPAIGGWVVLEACKTLALWQQEDGARDLVLSINVSVDQFMKPDFVASVLSRIEALKVDPARLKLELTESLMATDIDTIVEKMRALRAVGLTISLDDFGTGYSSLSYLRQLPIHEIKIDRSFVQEAPENLRNRFLLKSIFDIARMLDLSVVAEGIETKEQFVFLQSVGCTEFQGYYFGRPMPLADFQKHWAQDSAPPLAETA